MLTFVIPGHEESSVAGGFFSPEDSSCLGVTYKLLPNAQGNALWLVLVPVFD